MRLITLVTVEDALPKSVMVPREAVPVACMPTVVIDAMMRMMIDA